MWRAVAIDHWVTTLSGHPISIKCYPMGWILVRKASYHGRAGQVHRSLRSAVREAISNPVG